MNPLAHESFDLHMLHRPKILIIEDNEIYQKFWQSLFRTVNPNAVITYAQEAVQATEKFSKEHFDLIISDIFLPDSKSGIEIWKYYQNLEKGEFKFVLTSGITYEKMTHLCGPANTTPPFLQKPYQASDCVALLYGLLMS